VAHQIYKRYSSWIKKAGTSDSATNAKKDLNMKRRNDLNRFSTQNDAKVVPG
jgi:hypothetical protein